MQIFALIFYIIMTLSYLHGIYLSIHEGFWSFVFATIIIPWGVIKGFIGFF